MYRSRRVKFDNEHCSSTFVERPRGASETAWHNDLTLSAAEHYAATVADSADVVVLTTSEEVCKWPSILLHSPRTFLHSCICQLSLKHRGTNNRLSVSSHVKLVGRVALASVLGVLKGSALFQYLVYDLRTLRCDLSRTTPCDTCTRSCGRERVGRAPRRLFSQCESTSNATTPVMSL